MKIFNNKRTAIAERGFLHVLIPTIVVVIVAALGTYLIYASHADSKNVNTVTKNAAPMKITHKFRSPSRVTMNKITQYSLSYWNVPTACGSGKQMKYTYYNKNNSGRLPKSLVTILNAQFGTQTGGEQYGHAAAEQSYLTDALAYALIGRGLDINKGELGHCHIYFNKEHMKKTYETARNGGSLTINPNQFVCTIVVHETGHLMGFDHTFDTETNKPIGKSSLNGNQWFIMANHARIEGQGNLSYAPGCRNL